MVPTVGGGRRVMAKRSPHSFKKWQREVKRKQKAQEKMARRQGKKELANDTDTTDPAAGNVEGEGSEGAQEE
jgi:hypothetical protein